VERYRLTRVGRALILPNSKRKRFVQGGWGLLEIHPFLKKKITAATWRP